MSGFYNNWIKVNNPNLNNNIVPMESNGFQKPFYFGGSQVPYTLGTESHEIKHSHCEKTDFLPNIEGKGIQKTVYKKLNNIHIPRKINLG